MKQSIVFPYQANYSISHEPTFSEDEIWIVFHGYGQLAEFFIRNFIPFDNPNRLFIAPEGTNYAYLKGFEGRVGANWMTRHEREISIANNHRYLDLLMEKFLLEWKETPRINVLGFSQGAATATRWASRWPGSVNKLVLWAGGFAHDMNINDAKNKFSTSELTLVLGDQDEFLTPKNIDLQQRLVKKLELKVKTLHFNGGHEFDQETLKKVMDSV